MPDLVTVTLNPAIDLSTSVDRVVPTAKLRCGPELRDPGGGGINVARVLKRLGHDVVAVYPVGGPTGQRLEMLLDEDGIVSRTVPVAEETRESFTVIERRTGKEFRFVMHGPRLSPDEFHRIVEAIESISDPRYVIFSGSVPEGIPPDYFTDVAKQAKARGVKMVLDSSGAPLRAGLAGGVYLVKPNLNELAEMTGRRVEEQKQRLSACRRIVAAGEAEIVALTLGDRGALLVSRDEAWSAPALPVEPKSTVGAGDSFLAGLISVLSRGGSLPDALRAGVAAGSAALMTAGTALAKPEDFERMRAEVRVKRED